MGTRGSNAIAPALLVAAGVGFAWLGWRTIGLERAEARGLDRRRAEEALAALERADAPPASAGATTTWVEAAVEPDPVPGAPEQDALLLDEAAYRERTAGDLAGALSLLERLGGVEPATPFSRVAALRGGIVARRLERTETARTLLSRAAESSPGLADPAGPLVRSGALRHLAALDVEAGSDAGTLALLAEADEGRRLRADLGLDGGDALAALAGEIAGREMALPPPLRARLDRAVAHAALGHRVAAAAPRRGAGLAGGLVAWREGTDLRAVEATDLGRLWPAVEASYGVRLTAATSPDGLAEGATADRLPGVVEGVWVVAEPRPRETAGGIWLPVVAGLAVYALGAVLAIASLARQARVARMQTDFVAAVSHEMKTPIASVQAMAERLADGAVASPAKALDYAERIHAEMLRLGASVRNVLDASRIERGGGRAVVRPQPGEPSAVVADVAEALRPVLERRGYSFDVETSPAARPLPVDADALRSVLTNLLDNAAKFSSERREVTLRAGPRGGGGFRIEVLDRGPGVPPADRAHVFDRFWRGSDAKRAAVPGLGLGLHVARELVLAHGGSLTVADREGGGAAFVVDLPEAA